MSKKRKKIDVFHIGSVENTLRQMPRYNAHACGYGNFQDKNKHPNRAQRKHQFRRELSKLSY